LGNEPVPGYAPPELCDQRLAIRTSRQPTASCEQPGPPQRDPRAVTLRYRGVRSIEVSPHWLGDPDTYLGNSLDVLLYRSVFPSIHPLLAEALQHLSCSCAHFRVQPDAARRLPPKLPPQVMDSKVNQRQLSWSSMPLRRVGTSESTPPRFAEPGTFRPQGFSPSRRITPRLHVRPCFMPVTSLGFCPSGIFPRCQHPRLVAPELPS
jgi:hypothetical protein